MVGRSVQKTGGNSAGFEPTKPNQKNGEKNEIR